MCLKCTETFYLHRWKSETVGLRCDRRRIHLNSLHYCINIPALVCTLLFCFSRTKKCLKRIPFDVLSFLFVVHRQRPLRRLLLHHRSPWPWPTTGTWICKHSYTSRSHRSSQPSDRNLTAFRSLVEDHFATFVARKKKKATLLKAGGNFGTFFPHRKQSSNWLSGYLCHTGVVREIPAWLLMTFKDKTMEHSTFDFVSSVPDLCERKCHKAFW